MSIKSLWLTGLLVVGACAVNAQTGPVYWSTNPNLACGAYGDAAGKPTQLSNGNYACYMVGTLPWNASGAGWASSIRVSAPPSAPVAYFFDFSDANGAPATLDFMYQGDPKTYTDVSASQALFANQPLEVSILGKGGDSPNYVNAITGPVVVTVYCPDANTCSQAQAQLIYSALPSEPWSLSVPVVWDWQTSYAWSAVGVDGGTAASTDQVSFVIYNLDIAAVPAAHTYTINVYDANGALNASVVTPSIAQFGSYGVSLYTLFPKLPAGTFKLQVVSSTTDAYIAFEALQFHGTSATALVSTAEVIPAAAAATTNSAAGKARRLAPSMLRHTAPLHIAK